MNCPLFLFFDFQVPGGSVNDSCTFGGCMLNKDVVHTKMRRYVDASGHQIRDFMHLEHCCCSPAVKTVFTWSMSSVSSLCGDLSRKPGSLIT